MSESTPRTAAVVGQGAIADAIARQLGADGMPVFQSETGEGPEQTLSRAARAGQLAVVVACPSPGQEHTASLADLSPKDWGAALNGSLVATAETCRLAWQHMRPHGYGRIVTVAGRDALGAQGHGAAGAAEAAIISLSRTLALEAAPDGVTVNCVAPGIVEDDRYQQLPEDEQQRLAKLQPGGRVGRPEEVAAAVAFFADPESGYITGQTLYVCGGTSLFSSLSV